MGSPRWIGRIIGVMVALVVTGGIVRADEGMAPLSLQESSVARYARLVQPVMVETLLVVRQPLDVGRHRALDQRSQLAWLEALLKRVRLIEPPSSAVQTHQLILDGLEQFRAAVRLQLDGQALAAEGRIAAAQRAFEEAGRRLRRIAPTVLPISAVEDAR